LCAKPCIGDQPFAVVLPDVILDEYSANQNTDNLAAMITRYKATQSSQIMVAPVAEAEVDQYGVADCAGINPEPGQSTKIFSMVEKPQPADAPSNLAVVGRYVLSEKIWPLLENTPVGAGNEIQLTDAIDMLIASERVDAFCLSGLSHDCGSKLGYMMAFAEYGLNDKNLGAKFKKQLTELLLKSDNLDKNIR